MLHTLRENYNNSHIQITSEFQKDINWFLTFLPQFTKVTFLDKRPIQATIDLDVCLTGIGACYENAVYAYKFLVVPSHYPIVHLEMINILVALRLWGNIWKNKKVIVKCDNQAVSSVLNTGKSRDPIFVLLLET